MSAVRRESRREGLYSPPSMRKFPDPPPPEETDIVLVDSVTIATAFRHVGACEGCSKKADMPFDWLLDATTGRNPATTDYVMEAPARCPRCRRGITEKTLVEVSEE